MLFIFFFSSLSSLVLHTVLFLKPLYKTKWPEKSCFFFKEGFEVCLLNKVFAVIIKLHIKVQNHLVLEVTENCYHLMALWAELSQTTLHARRNKDPVSGHCPGTYPGSGQHSDCWFPIVASWVLNLTVTLLRPWSIGVIPTLVSLAAILISLEFSDLQSTYLSWDQRSHDKFWVQLCNSHHGKSISKPGFLGEREREGKRETG